MGEEQGLSADEITLLRGFINLARNREAYVAQGPAMILGAAVRAADLIERLLDAARAERLRPPVVEVEEKVFSSLGASKAPSSASAGVAETPSGGWIPSTGVNPAPGAHVDVRFRNGDVCRSARSEAWDWALEPTGGCIVVVWRLARGSPTDCQTSGGEA